MTAVSLAVLVAVVVSYATGILVISIVVAAIAGLVFTLWRRSAGTGNATLAVSSAPRTDSHAISALFSESGSGLDHSAPAPVTVQAQQRRDHRPAAAPLVAPGDPHPSTEAARGPHPSGLGAAELAAIVENGMSSLRSDVDALGQLIDSVVAASAVPEDLPARPASQQVALVDQMVAMIASDLERAHRLAETVAVDVDQGHRARAEVQGELARIGLPTDFFVAMDTTAAELAVDLVRTQLAVERLVRRFESLSSLYSSVRPTLGLLTGLDDTLGSAAAVADPWRRSPESVDLVQRSQTAPLLPG